MPTCPSDCVMSAALGVLIYLGCLSSVVAGVGIGWAACVFLRREERQP